MAGSLKSCPAAVDSATPEESLEAHRVPGAHYSPSLLFAAQPDSQSANPFPHRAGSLAQEPLVLHTPRPPHVWVAGPREVIMAPAHPCTALAGGGAHCRQVGDGVG